jgi:hypothetical protein
MEEALKRSMLDTSTDYSFYNLKSEITHMDPCALIFAAGTWGRPQDVKNTVF